MKKYTKKQESILQLAIHKNGAKQQILKAIEELSELTKELARQLTKEGNHANTVDEMADVEIMMKQVKKILGGDIENEISERIDFKIDRLQKRLEKPTF